MDVNRDEKRAAAPLPDDLAARIRTLNAGGLVLSASVEAEIATLDLGEQAAFLEDLGQHESALARFILAAYGLLDLISFFTVGVDEVRAGRFDAARWLVRRPGEFTRIWSAVSFERRLFRTRRS